MRFFHVVFGCYALAIASMIVCTIIIMIFIGMDATNIIFDYSPGIPIVLTILWCPFVNKRLK